MKKALLMSCVATAMMTSCFSGEETSGPEEKFSGNVTLTVEPFTFDDATRASLTNVGDTLAFAWDKDEAVGFFPVAPVANGQTKLALKDCSGNSTTSAFSVSGWTPVPGNTYAACYPYQNMPSETSYTAVPVVMTGQTQDGNASLAHIEAGYDYMYAVADVPTNGDMNFGFKHVTSIIMLELTMPDTATWVSVTLSNNDGNDVFTTSATMNVATGVVTPVEISSKVTLSLNNVSTTASDKTLTLYLAVLPTTTGELTLTARTSSNKLYGSTIASKTLVAGKACRVVANEWVDKTTGVEKSYEWVDLGLPSGLKWATMNVGATSVTDYGKYYAWGETKACKEEDPSNSANYSYNSDSSYVKKYFAWETYKWGDVVKSYIAKYCTDPSYGTVDNKSTLEPEDDAATQNWGGAWRMPTHYEVSELVNNCYWVWTSSYNDSGIAGYIVYAAKNPSDGGLCVRIKNSSESYSLSDTHIFLPAAGYRSGKKFVARGEQGYIWLSSLCSLDCDMARSLDFGLYLGGELFRNPHDWWERYIGISVRAVCE